MSIVLIILLACLTGIVLIRGIVMGPGYYLTPPVLSAAVLLGWFLPQAITTLNYASGVPENGVLLLLLSANLSFTGLLIGWSVGRGKLTPQQYRRVGIHLAIKQLRSGRYGFLAAAFVAVAALVQALTQLQPAEALSAQQPTGLITILMALWTLNPIALFLGITCFIVFRTKISFIVALIAIACYAAPILLHFKRNDILEFGAVILFSLWIVKNWSVPRLAIPVGFLVGLLLLFGVGEIRRASGYSLAADGSLERNAVTIETIAKIDWAGVIENAQLANDEFMNGAFTMDYVSRYSSFGLGANLWNAFVQRWVPGQLVGDAVKQSMYITSFSSLDVLASYGQNWRVGTTSTGFPQGYKDFWFIAIVFYVAIGRICRHLYSRAVTGDIPAASVYMGTVLLGIPSFTHGTYSFFLALPLMIISYLFVERLIGDKRKAQAVY